MIRLRPERIGLEFSSFRPQVTGTMLAAVEQAVPGDFNSVEDPREFMGPP